MSMYRLENKILNYPWGDRAGFITRLLGLPKTDDKPEAELWMGAHPLAPSTITVSKKISLYDEVRERPEEVLGPRVNAMFCGEFPFLFKVLAAGKPLSIQAHPSKARAKQGFAEEEALGIAPNAPNRNYKDKNHKPEILLALTKTVSMKGFRSMEETASYAKLLHVPAFESLADAASLKEFFTTLLFLDAELTKNTVETVLAKAGALPDLVARVLTLLHSHYGFEIGVLAPLFLNVIELSPGQALYIPSGELHAYVEGAGMELMANSDNVLRGGLTPKHVDKEELLRVLSFTPGSRKLIAPTAVAEGETEYSCEAPEIMLAAIRITPQAPRISPAVRSVEILFCANGKGEADNGVDKLSLGRGDSIVVYASSPPYRLKGDMTVYKASVGKEVF